MKELDPYDEMEEISQNYVDSFTGSYWDAATKALLKAAFQTGWLAAQSQGVKNHYKKLKDENTN